MAATEYQGYRIEPFEAAGKWRASIRVWMVWRSGSELAGMGLLERESLQLSVKRSNAHTNLSTVARYSETAAIHPSKTPPRRPITAAGF
jgi:hypothetical protein